jgi:hypothetical protein
MANIDHGCIIEQQWTQDGRLLAELEAQPDEDLAGTIGELLGRAFDDLDMRIVEIRVRQPRTA